MKKIILGMLASCFILAASVTQSKAQVSVNLNVGTWNPPAEYGDASYYYLPDVDSYYYVPTHQYVYLSGNNWVWRNTLPVRYSNYNINDGYKVAVYRPRPYRYYRYDRPRYARYRGVRNVIVRDRYYRPHTRVINRTHYVNRPSHNRMVNRQRAIGHQRAVTRQRAIGHQRAVTRQRAIGHQRAVTRQRAIGHQRAVTRQRAIGHQRAVTRQRAIGRQRAVAHQRAIGRQRAVAHQRAIGGNKQHGGGHKRAIGH